MLASLRPLLVALALVGGCRGARDDTRATPAPLVVADAAVASSLQSLPSATDAAAPALRPDEIAASELPPEGRATLALIHRGGPFPYDKDGVVFRNFERHLPTRPSGYYHEYTVPTPGSHSRGVRRIVAGMGESRDVRTSGEYWYTGDHYDSFRRIRE